jgi:hypothetical protein
MNLKIFKFYSWKKFNQKRRSKLVAKSKSRAERLIGDDGRKSIGQQSRTAKQPGRAEG